MDAPILLKLRKLKISKLLGLLALSVLMSACAGNEPGSAAVTPGLQPAVAQTVAPSLYEQRLLRILEREEAFETWLQTPEGSENERLAWAGFQEVARAYDVLIADVPDRIEARILYGKFLSRMGDAEGAFEQFSLAYRMEPNLAVISQELGTLYAEQGEITQALSFYLRAIELEPNESFYHLALGELLVTFRAGLMREGVFDSATLDAAILEAFGEAAQLSPRDVRLQFRLGEAFAQVEQPDWGAALTFWTQLLQRQDLTPLQRQLIHLRRAESLGELGRYGEARGVLLQVTSGDFASERQALMEALIEAEGRRR